jgi:hypothetical protein
MALDETPGLPPSARPLDEDELALVDRARATIDAATDAGPGEDGVHTMGAAVRASDGRVFVGVNVYHFIGGPCGRDRELLLDYHPGVRVILPTVQGARSVVVEDLMPLATRWSPEGGSATS